MRTAPKEYAGWLQCHYDLADITALKALAVGIASKDEQMRAMKFIVGNICEADNLSFHPESERLTVFSEGRRFVGTEIRRFISSPIEQFKPPQPLKGKRNVR